MQEGQPAERTRTMSYTDEFLKFAGASVSLIHFSHVPKTRVSGLSWPWTFFLYQDCFGPLRSHYSPTGNALQLGTK